MEPKQNFLQIKTIQKKLLLKAWSIKNYSICALNINLLLTLNSVQQMYYIHIRIK